MKEMLRSRRHIVLACIGLLVLSWACVQTSTTRPEEPKGELGTGTPEVEKKTPAASSSAVKVPSPAPRAKPAPPVSFTKPESETRVAVLWTASVQGYVAPCGCTAEPLGGVARYKALVDEAKRAYGQRVLVLDAGDLLFEKEDDHHPADLCQADARSALLLSTYAQAGLAATTLGTLDDVRGAAWRDKKMAEHQLASVGVNPPRPVGHGAPFSKSILVERGGVLVGVTGVFIHEKHASGEEKSLVEINEDAKKIRPMLQSEVDRLVGKGAKAVIVLAQANARQARLVLEGVANVDVILVGRRPGERPAQAIALESGAVLLAAGAQAQYLGVAELEVGGRTPKAPLVLDDGEQRAKQRTEKLTQKVELYQNQMAETEPGERRTFLSQRVKDAQDELLEMKNKPIAAPSKPHLKVRSVALARANAVDPSSFAALQSYEESIPALVAGCEENIECEAAPKGTPTYVGAETCAACHRGATRFWQRQILKVPATADDGSPYEREVGHVKAWDTLVEGGKESDRSCVGCHSIGFMEPGGYCKTSEVDFRTGVQCESCHGPGSLHVTEGDPRFLPRPTVGEQTCRGCHQVPHIPSTESFVYEQKLLHVLGEGHGEARAAELKRELP